MKTHLASADPGRFGFRNPGHIFPMLAVAAVLASFVAAALGFLPVFAQDEEAVGGLTLTSDTPGALAVSWDVPDQAPTDYRVNWAKSAENFPSYTENYGNAYPTTNSHNVASLEEGVEYKVRVRARYSNPNRGGPWSDVAQHTVLGTAEAVAPARPEGLSADVSHDSVRLTWDDPDDPSITGYQILRLQRDLHDLGEFQIHVDDTRESLTSYVDTDVAASKRYVYRVRARNSEGLSRQSKFANADTPAPVSTATPTPTTTPEATATPTPTATPEATATPTPTATPEATATPTPTATASGKFQELTFVTVEQEEEDETPLEWAEGTSEEFSEPWPTDITSTRRIEVGETLNGLIWRHNDKDKFVFTGVEGKTYNVVMSPYGYGSDDPPYFRIRWPRISWIYSPEGKALRGTLVQSYRRPATVRFLADSSGDYQINLGSSGGYDVLWWTSGYYELTVTEVTGSEADDYSAQPSTKARVLADGTPFQITTNYTGDEDWVAVDLEEGVLYRMGQVGDEWLRSGDRRVVTSDWVVDVQGVWRYTLDAPVVREARINAMYMPPNLVVPTNPLSPFSTHDPSDTPVTWYLPLESGTHYLSFGGMSKPATGQFNVTRLNAQLRDTSATTATRHVITSGTGAGVLHGYRKDTDCTYYEAEHNEDLTGQLHAMTNGTGDLDWIGADLVAGKTYLIYAQGANTYNGTAGQLGLGGVYDSHGVLVPDNWRWNSCSYGGSKSDAHGTFHATTSGRHYFEVASGKGAQGLYKFTLIEAPEPLNPTQTTEFTGWTDTTGTLAPGGSATSFIGSRWDRDWFKVTLEKGDGYRFEMVGVSHADYGNDLRLSSPYIEGVYDSQGVYQIGTTHDGTSADGTSRALFVAEEAGEYFVGVRSNQPEYPWGWYQIGLTQFNLSTESDIGHTPSTSYEITLGEKVMSVISDLWDNDWFKLDLEAGKTYSFVMSGATGSKVWPRIESLRDAEGTKLEGTEFCNTNGTCIKAPASATRGSRSSVGVPNGSVAVYYTAVSDGAHYVDTGAFNFILDPDTYEVISLGKYMYSFKVDEIAIEDVPLPPAT